MGALFFSWTRPAAGRGGAFVFSSRGGTECTQFLLLKQ
jgi:hypothetical protein